MIYINYVCEGSRCDTQTLSRHTRGIFTSDDLICERRPVSLALSHVRGLSRECAVQASTECPECGEAATVVRRPEWVGSTGRRCYEPVCLDFPLWGDCSRVERPGVAGLLKPPALSGRESADTETDSAPEREDSEVPRRRARMSHLASDEFSRRRRPGE